ncbi:uncharacterized protein F4822DRAFT_433955 [Hypoxylon trugodes]|uniref:uncharacterized protein n=1 Tax=Hypoxylon trugodes TaxID=326681 RepID=UPI00219C1381|nr:uncharacterized protein F4822DRAFT_433955 [Hypoxylon trugodes]KAI1384005.1 hypothetical protein F4822DRAFT_433955 [Hypoxylon trugodes]
MSYDFQLPKWLAEGTRAMPTTLPFRPRKSDNTDGPEQLESQLVKSNLLLPPTHSEHFETNDTNGTDGTHGAKGTNDAHDIVESGTKRAALDDGEPIRPPAKRLETGSLPIWKEVFKSIVDSAPSEDASVRKVRYWFYRIGKLHNIGRHQLPDLQRLSMRGHNLRQADYSDIKEYLLGIADKGSMLERHVALIAADAYEAVQLKIAMDSGVKREDITTYNARKS